MRIESTVTIIRVMTPMPISRNATLNSGGQSFIGMFSSKLVVVLLSCSGVVGVAVFREVGVAVLGVLSFRRVPVLGVAGSVGVEAKFPGLWEVV